MAEQFISRLLQETCADVPLGSSIPDSKPLNDLLSALEYFIPEVLFEAHSEWKGEYLDGIYPAKILKSGDQEIELMGLGIILNDQTLVPLHLRLQGSSINEDVSWCELRLGVHGTRGMRRTPYSQLSQAMNQLYRVDCDPEKIGWFYKVTFGERECVECDSDITRTKLWSLPIEGLWIAS